jgi:uncharacterized phage protein (TIGR02220 family)
MARPTKQGIDYFPLDTEFDDNMELLIADIGAEGLGIIITIWQTIYRNNGYFIVFDDKFPLKIKYKCFSDTETIINVVKKAINVNIYDKNMFEKYQILTSRGIQKRFFDASKRKKRVEAIKDFLLIDVSEYNNLVFVNNNFVNVGKNATKEKEKEKENIYIPYAEIIAYLNSKTGSNYKAETQLYRKHIKARWNEGFRLEDFKKVVDVKCKQWLTDPNMVKYLRPETLFSPKMNSYLNEPNFHDELEERIELANKRLKKFIQGE